MALVCDIIAASENAQLGHLELYGDFPYGEAYNRLPKTSWRKKGRLIFAWDRVTSR